MEQVGWEEFLKSPLGTWPYVVQHTLKDYAITAGGDTFTALKANPTCWNRYHPMTRKIEFVRFAPKNSLSALSEGKVDLVTSLIPKDALNIAGSPHCTVVKGRDDVTCTVRVETLGLIIPYRCEIYASGKPFIRRV